MNDVTAFLVTKRQAQELENPLGFPWPFGRAKRFLGSGDSCYAVRDEFEASPHELVTLLRTHGYEAHWNRQLRAIVVVPALRESKLDDDKRYHSLENAALRLMMELGVRHSAKNQWVSALSWETFRG